MNSKLSITCCILTISFLFFGCGGHVNDNNNASASSLSLHIGNEKYFIIDRKESVLIWEGSGVKGKHYGYAYISKGELMIENGQLMAGKVEIDMNKTEGNGHGRNNNLINHLKGPDFFDVKNFPFSTMVISKVATIIGESKTVTGNLTIKGITQQVIFPARIEVKGGIVKANPRLIIDRTKWDIRYRSGKFYDNLADKLFRISSNFRSIS